MQSDDALVWVTDEGDGWYNRVISNAFEEDMHRIITSDIGGVKLEPGIYRLVRVEAA